jgi:hypothetical protein
MTIGNLADRGCKCGVQTWDFAGTHLHAPSDDGRIAGFDKLHPKHMLTA